MRYLTVVSRVDVIGHIWMPNIVCAMSYDVRSEDVTDDDGNVTRESVEDWLSSHAGDFQSVDDFRADIALGDADVIIPWNDEESEMTFAECMFPSEDD